jgi:glycerol kinase
MVSVAIIIKSRQFENMEYILALDQGTTSSRAVLVSQGGEIYRSAQKEFSQIFPNPGWVEHDPEEIWTSQSAVMREVMEGAKVAAIGITNQRETTIVWNRKTGKPIYNAIVWQDRRTTELCAQLKKEGLEPLIRRKTGLLLDPYFSATKIAWILNNVPGARAQAERGELAFGTVDTWLIWKLTEGKHHLTDVTNASRTLLFDIHTRQWDLDLLKAFNIPSSLLPAVKSSSDVYATTASGIPISGCAGDQQAALFGQACTQPGRVKATYGTGCFLLMHTGEKPILSQNQLLTTIAYQIKDKTYYALEGSLFNAGTVVQWLRDSLGIIKTSSEIEQLAASVPGSEGTYFVPAFTGLGAPHWNPYARGMIVGLTRGTKAAHIARAALEAIAYQVTDVLKAMEADSKIKISELRVDGGAVKDNLLMQFQADVMQVPVIRPQITELTALGAAYLAGLGIGFWKDLNKVAAYWKQERSFQPHLPKSEVEKLHQKWSLALQCAQLWGKP